MLPLNLPCKSLEADKNLSSLCIDVVYLCAHFSDCVLELLLNFVEIWHMYCTHKCTCNSNRGYNVAWWPKYKLCCNLLTDKEELEVKLFVKQTSSQINFFLPENISTIQVHVHMVMKFCRILHRWPILMLWGKGVK